MSQLSLETVLQSERIEYIKHDWGYESMIQVYGKYQSDEFDSYITCWIIPVEKIEKELECYSRDMECLKPGISTYSDGRIEYKRFNNDEMYEPFVIEQHYHGLQDKYIELVEEFRLLFNLYFDTKAGQYKDIEKDCIVAEFKKNGDLYISKYYLKIYLAYKNYALVLFEDRKVWFDEGELYSELISSNKSQIDESSADYHFGFRLCEQRMELENFKSYYTLLDAKKIVYPSTVPISELNKTGIDYQKFIVGEDNNGKLIKNTCNPNMLADYYGKNDGMAHYLTPVFFKPEVLKKYNDDDRYEVDDGVIKYGSFWAVHIDNNHKNYVIAYLGDLGRDLPEAEQHHWVSYNVLGDGNISEVAFKRDFKAQFSDPRSILFKFRNKYDELASDSLNILGEKILRELKDEDKYNLVGLHIPSDNSQSDFDFMVLYLTKLLIDSLNVNWLEKNVNIIPKKKASIFFLEELMKEKNLIGFEYYVKFLRDLQELRSSGTGHTKGRNYDKIIKKFDFNRKLKSIVFKEILEQAYDFLNYLQLNLENLK